VAFLAARYAAPWPGIDAATPADLVPAVLDVKEGTREEFPKSGFTTHAAWTHADAVALQRALDAARRNPDAIWNDFPGDVWKPLEAVALRDAVRLAIENYRNLGGAMAPPENLVLAWAMKESGWNPHASAYGWTCGRSTAAGLLAVTRRTHDACLAQGLLPFREAWSEARLTDPILNLTTAFFILEHAPGRGLAGKLSAYHDPGNPGDGDRYAHQVLTGAAYLDGLAETPDDAAPDEEAGRLAAELSRRVH
jgi:hypothetical protein